MKNIQAKLYHVLFGTCSITSASPSPKKKKWYVVYFLHCFCDSANNEQFLIRERMSSLHFDFLVTHVDLSLLRFSLKTWGSEKELFG